MYMCMLQKNMLSLIYVVKCSTTIQYDTLSNALSKLDAMMENNKHFYMFIFSSPEHEVLMVSYCGQWLSVVVCRVSCVVRQHLMFTLYRPHL